MNNLQLLLKAWALCLCMAACGGASPSAVEDSDQAEAEPQATVLSAEPATAQSYKMFIDALKEYMPRVSLADMVNNPGNYVSIALAYDQTPETFIHPNTPEGATNYTHSFGYVAEDGLIFAMGQIETPRGQELVHLLVFDEAGKLLVPDFLISGGGMEGNSYISSQVLPDGTLEVVQKIEDLDTGEEKVMHRTKYRFDKSLKTFKEIN